jgi:hypothetical protein
MGWFMMLGGDGREELYGFGKSSIEVHFKLRNT